ncbi:MAG TPA: response regulator, partial [Chitinophagaceae bacterium]|nr:response regulator [Chitinophagaceae bacterium]
LEYTRSSGYKGVVAVRGDEGLALARQYLPVGILLDIQLPVQDGWEVMEALKNHPETRSIPVHIMSSHEVKRESLVRGAVDFINKPVATDEMQRIFRRIEQILEHPGHKVLIVEEDPRHARALAYFLETRNVNTEVASGPASAITALVSGGASCVVLDISASDGNGYESIEEVRKHPGLEALPIIIFTAKNLTGAEAARIRQFADSVVVKTAHSYQRIFDEVSLFLHLLEEHGTGLEERPAARRLGALEEVLRNRKILVTDDDVRNIFSLTKALEAQGMQVHSALDGKEALQRLEEVPDMDIVLMDIMMPEMDGYETMRRIRSLHRFRQLPLIAVTAKAMAGDREKCIEAGASDYISKPVDIDQLLSLLRVWLYESSR